MSENCFDRFQLLGGEVEVGGSRGVVLDLALSAGADQGRCFICGWHNTQAMAICASVCPPGRNLVEMVHHRDALSLTSSA